MRHACSARCAALQAQQCAMLSCIEESERVRLEAEAGGRQLAALALCGSPAALTDWALQLSCKSTEDSAYGDDAASHGSCLTPVAEGNECCREAAAAGPRGERPWREQQHHQPRLSPPVLKAPPKVVAAAGGQGQQQRHVGAELAGGED